MLTLDDQLREACRDSGKSAAEIARGIGASEKGFPRVLLGKRGLSPALQVKLAEFLGLQITLSRPLTNNPKKAKKRLAKVTD
jgi:transcriptional regulator with XRE-family HTH domain